MLRKRPPPSSIDYALIGSACARYAALGYEAVEVPWCDSGVGYQLTRPEGAAKRDIASVLGFHVASAEQSFISMLARGELPAGKYQATTPCFRDESSAELSETKCQWFLKNELIVVPQLTRSGIPLSTDTILSLVAGAASDAAAVLSELLGIPSCVDELTLQLAELRLANSNVCSEASRGSLLRFITTSDSRDLVPGIDIEARMPDGSWLELGSYGARRFTGSNETECEAGNIESPERDQSPQAFDTGVYVYGTGLAEPRASHFRRILQGALQST